MIKIFQISSELNTGSVGRIAEQIGESVLNERWESHIAYARDHQPSTSISYKIGNDIDIYCHAFYTRITDKHGFASENATKKLIAKIEKILPDLIQLQHMHGYFINIKILFEYLSKKNIPVVWTFHDCWSFTGHCAHYDFINCQKWQTQCEKCPQIHEYPNSLVDNSYQNYNNKKNLFNSVTNLTIVPVSKWLGEEVKKSFLKTQNVKVIHNGIDLEKFKPTHNPKIITDHHLENKFVILGVASPWTEKKGLKYFIELSSKLDKDFQIILIGLDQKQIKNLPANIIGIERTDNIQQLAEYYTIANVFINPTLEEALGMTNVEAQACGTPVITFKSGGAPETVSPLTGIVIDKGNSKQLHDAVLTLKEKKSFYDSSSCRNYIIENFDKTKCFSKYITLYKELLQVNN